VDRLAAIDIRSSRRKVVAPLNGTLDDAGIEIPFPYRTLTFNENRYRFGTYRDRKRSAEGHKHRPAYILIGYFCSVSR